MDFTFERNINYYETDKMGVVHHSNYIRFLEEARCYWLQSIEMPFDLLEDNGITIPVDKSFAVNLIDEDLILRQIKLAKEQNPDLICVSMHWGIEYQLKQNQEQEKLKDLLFNNSVDIILGSHPHVLQPMKNETITLDDGSTNDCFVIYSLGNFMSGQTKENTRSSVILNIDITKSEETGKTKLNKVEYIPIYMYKSPTARVHKYKILDIEKIKNRLFQSFINEEFKMYRGTYDKVIFSMLDTINSYYDCGIYRGTAQYNSLETERKIFEFMLG